MDLDKFAEELENKFSYKANDSDGSLYLEVYWVRLARHVQRMILEAKIEECEIFRQKGGLSIVRLDKLRRQLTAIGEKDKA